MLVMLLETQWRGRPEKCEGCAVCIKAVSVYVQEACGLLGADNCQLKLNSFVCCVHLTACLLVNKIQHRHTSGR